MKKIMRGLVLLACAAVFAYSGGMLAQYLFRSHQEEGANLRLAEQVHKAEKEAAALALEEYQKYAESGVLYQYDALWQQNHDMAGWLRIEGTAVDYPVMHTPEEPEHYLHRAFDKSEAASGSLFIGDGWSETGQHTVIYGHHMKDGSMFTALEDYKSPEFAREHPVIAYDTLTEEGRYEVLGAFYSRVYSDQDEDVFRYYQYADLSSKERYDEYVQQVRQASLYDTGVEASYGEQLLTLSTCSYHTYEGRFVVVAKKQAGGPSDAE